MKRFLKWMQVAAVPTLCTVGLFLLCAGSGYGVVLILAAVVLMARWVVGPDLGVWPTTGAGSAAQGVLITGVTTIKWGTLGLGGGVTGFVTVLDIKQSPLVENVKLPNGDGVTSTRLQIIDGQKWDITVRDDTNLTAASMRVGQTISIDDAAGFIGNIGLKYVARICEPSFDAALKEAAKRTITVENLLLIESQAGT